ncbi:MAG: MATE family efflux transporter, partial [Eubacterium sp.]|nr:MATE family efflux transporter [Eubacterium sp.]
MYKNAARYVSLSVAGMIGVSVYILADTFFISLGFGADGLAVLNMTLPIYGLIYAIGAMLGLGFAVDYSIRKAQKLKTDTIFMEAIFWSILISIPFVLIGIFSPDGILRLLGADAELAQMGKEYTRLILCGSPLFMCNYSFMSFCRNDNAPSYAMIGSIAGSMYNIVFDYVFMFVAGLGFTGAALATVGCPVVTMLFCTAHFRSGKNGVPFRIGKPSLRHLLRCSSVGMSGFIGDFANGVTTAVFNFVMLGLAGNVAVAAYGVIANIALVCISVNNGIAQGMQPLISKTFGKGEKENVAKLLKFGMIVMAATSV